MDCCEVRVPTYKRPQQLERCLRSLIAQTHPDWVALVQDDSQAQEGRDVVQSLGDERIRYQPNASQLGCCGNIDLAFSGNPRAGGRFACVLEDDNWLEADFLKQNLDALSSSGCAVVLRNQSIVLERTGKEPEKTGRTTRGDVFGDADRTLSPLEIRSAILLSEGLSNGGIFWDLSAPVSFVVGESVQFSPLQEFCRSLQATVPVRFAAQPLACFSYPEDESTSREPLENRRFNRGRQSIILQLIAAHGSEIRDCALRLFRARPEAEHLVHAALADASTLPPLRPGAIKAWLKGIAKRVTVKDPLASYWASKGLPPVRSAPSDS